MTQILSSAGIKRQMLAESDITGIRKKIMNDISKEKRGDYVKMGDAFESLVQSEAWVYLEAYMMKFVMNKILHNEGGDVTPGFINLMHYIDQVIRAKDEIRVEIARENEKV
jgi:hypothetical protein